MYTKLFFVVVFAALILLTVSTVTARAVDDPTPTPSQLGLLVQSDHARGDYLQLDPARPGVSYPNPPEERTVHLSPCLRVLCGTPAPRP
jgi:hypothetical protein